MSVLGPSKLRPIRVRMLHMEVVEDLVWGLGCGMTDGKRVGRGLDVPKTSLQPKGRPRDS